MWQPIETAPKDGTRVLLARGHEVEIGRFVGDKPAPGAGGYVYRNAWLVVAAGDPFECEYWEGDEPPTHWMPLPPAPEAL